MAMAACREGQPPPHPTATPSPSNHATAAALATPGTLAYAYAPATIADWEATLRDYRTVLGAYEYDERWGRLYTRGQEDRMETHCERGLAHAARFPITDVRKAGTWSSARGRREVDPFSAASRGGTRRSWPTRSRRA